MQLSAAVLGTHIVVELELGSAAEAIVVIVTASSAAATFAAISIFFSSQYSLSGEAFCKSSSHDMLPSKRIFRRMRNIGTLALPCDSKLRSVSIPSICTVVSASGRLPAPCQLFTFIRPSTMENNMPSDPPKITERCLGLEPSRDGNCMLSLSKHALRVEHKASAAAPQGETMETTIQVIWR
jgi:hypothetical protein